MQNYEIWPQMYRLIKIKVYTKVIFFKHPVD